MNWWKSSGNRPFGAVANIDSSKNPPKSVCITRGHSRSHGHAVHLKVEAIFHRFIDDVFDVWIYGEEALMEFFARANQYHPDIVFTHFHRKSVAYLDVQTSIQEDCLVTDLYEKPTNTHQYLLPSSNHPPHVHRDLPYGLAIRIRTIVSEQETLEVRLNGLSTFL